MSDADDPDRPATEYWKRLTESDATSPKTKPRKQTMPEESDSTDPLVLIVAAIRDNTEAIKAAASEMTAARHAMAEGTRKAVLQADALTADLRSNTLAVQQFAASERTIRRLQADRYVWAFAGAIAGAILASLAIHDLPILWRHIFG